MKEVCDIPVFHDDQHGTAVVVLAAVLNALKVVGKKIGEIRGVINGAGAAGCAIAHHLLQSGLRNLVICDRNGILDESDEGLTAAQRELSRISNPEGIKGKLSDAMRGADLFIGVSGPNLVSPEMVASMAPGSILFPMANPVPEISAEAAKKAGATIVGTGRSDFPNQINNVLAFPGIFRGALDVRAKDINKEMEIAASYAIADCVPPEELCAEKIVPSPLDRSVASRVAKAVADAAVRSGVARIKP
jgi:malate dehydrogenase (oxaloacetate-decarboxylating)